MRHRRFSPLLTLLLVLSAVILGHGAVTPAFGQGNNCGDCAQGGRCRCGDTVICPTKLGANDPVLSTVCSGTGLFVLSSVTLHVTGTLRGQTGQTDSCGIHLKSTRSFVTITTGTIDGFERGICGDGELTDNKFTKLTIRNPALHCIELDDQGTVITQNNTIDTVRCQNAGSSGVVVFGTNNKILRVKSTDNNGAGFSIIGHGSEPGDNQLLSSHALRNQGNGLSNDACGSLIRLNRFNDNHQVGIVDVRRLAGACTSAPSTYQRNQCERNNGGPSNPPNLCR